MALELHYGRPFPAFRRESDSQIPEPLMQSSSIGLPARALTMGIGLTIALSISVAAAPADRAPGHSSTAPPASATASATTGGQVAGLVGDDTCLTCHEGQKGIQKTLHGKAQNGRAPAAAEGGQGTCESCHGPGQKHVDSGKKEDIKRFTAMSAREVSATCLTCHARSNHVQWQGSMHDARNVTCTTCTPSSLHEPACDPSAAA